MILFPKKHSNIFLILILMVYQKIYGEIIQFKLKILTLKRQKLLFINQIFLSQLLKLSTPKNLIKKFSKLHIEIKRKIFLL